ncbi:TPA: hypothetical protein ACH9MR_005511, partial [Escherichia coli]
ISSPVCISQVFTASGVLIKDGMFLRCCKGNPARGFTTPRRNIPDNFLPRIRLWINQILLQ